MTNSDAGAIEGAGTVSASGVRYLPDGRRTFDPGHTASLRHGAYAVIHLGPRVDTIADELREHVPAFAPSDEVALRLLALALARLEACGPAITAAAAADPADQKRLRRNERSWANAARNMLGDLGMTPSSRVRLGIDLVRGTSLAAEVEAALAARDRADARMRATDDEYATP